MTIGKRARPPKRKAQDPPSSSTARRPRGASRNPEDSDEENEESRKLLKTEKAVLELTTVTFNILHVGPLRLSEKDTDLRRLTIAIEAALVEATGNTFKVNAFFLFGIKLSKCDSQSLMIEVIKNKESMEQEDDEDEPEPPQKPKLRVMFTGRESCARGLRFVSGERISSYLNLPVVLWEGRSSLWEHVHPVLTENLKQVHRETVRKRNDEVQIYYRLPVTKFDEAVIASTEINFLKWKKEISELGKELDDIKTLKRTLMRIWSEALSSSSATSDLSRAQLVKAATNTCVITSKGRMKIWKGSTLEDALPVLVQLTRILELRC